MGLFKTVSRRAAVLALLTASAAMIVYSASHYTFSPPGLKVAILLAVVGAATCSRQRPDATHNSAHRRSHTVHH